MTEDTQRFATDPEEVDLEEIPETQIQEVRDIPLKTVILAGMLSLISTLTIAAKKWTESSLISIGVGEEHATMAYIFIIGIEIGSIVLAIVNITRKGILTDYDGALMSIGCVAPILMLSSLKMTGYSLFGYAATVEIAIISWGISMSITTITIFIVDWAHIQNNKSYNSGFRDGRVSMASDKDFLKRLEADFLKRWSPIKEKAVEGALQSLKERHRQELEAALKEQAQEYDRKIDALKRSHERQKFTLTFEGEEQLRDIIQNLARLIGFGPPQKEEASNEQ